MVNIYVVIGISLCSYLLLVMIKSKTIVSNVKRYDNEQVVMYILMEM